jgi:hypothetical protein
MVCYAAVLATMSIAAPLAAQPGPDPRTIGTAPPSVSEGRVTGRIVRVTAAGERPVARQWVILHGIGATGGRAIDSARTAADGEFRIRYQRSPDSTQYFASTVHHGIAYVSGVLPADATPEDATLTVFDTTSAPLQLDVRGRHILLFAPSDGPRRRVAEIYDLSNDTTLTRITTDSGPPVWTGIIPRGFEDFSSGPELSSNESIRVVNGRVAAFAPVAPGLKRLAFTYSLPPTAFPASFLVEQSTQLLEVLLEDQRAELSGAGLVEGSPTTIEGRVFRRFQAADVPALAVVTVRVPPPVTGGSPKTPLIIAIGVVMAVALVVALRRRGRTTVAVSRAPAQSSDATDALAREIAELDAAFATRGVTTDAEREAYERQRATLKSELARRLAASRQAR